MGLQESSDAGDSDSSGAGDVVQSPPDPDADKGGEFALMLFNPDELVRGGVGDHDDVRSKLSDEGECSILVRIGVGGGYLESGKLALPLRGDFLSYPGPGSEEEDPPPLLLSHLGQLGGEL